MLAIGREALRLAPPQYDVLDVRADFSAEGVAKLHSEARVGSKVQPLDVDLDALGRLEEIRAAFKAVGQPLWAEATVTVDAAGTPKARFTYAG